MKNLWSRLFRRRTLDSDFREEIESHLSMRAETNRHAGMSSDAAKQDAKRRFGNPELIREEVYHFNGFRVLDALATDLRSSLRTLLRYPGVTCIALISLALGIGANTLAFSFVNALLFQRSPYPNSDRLVLTDDDMTPSDCIAIRDHTNDVFGPRGCFAGGDPLGASIADEIPGALPAERVAGQRFTAGVGPALGIEPQIGRWFSEADEMEAAGPVVVISHSLWQRRFGGASNILDRRIRLDGAPATVIGVMPIEFEFLVSTIDYWRPIRAEALLSQGDARLFGVVARLQPNISIELAQSRVAALTNRSSQALSQRDRRSRISVTRMDRYASEQFRDTALLLQSTVAFVLLIACANVTGLLLTQAMSHQRELAVRTALGSGIWRIVRQTLMHSLILSFAGGVLGLFVGWAGVRYMVNVVLPASIEAYGAPRGGMPRAVFDAGLDGNVLLFTFATTLLCGLAAAIAPALQVSRAQPLDVLRESSRTASPGVGRQRLRGVFVAVQIALAFSLLVSAVLMLTGLLRAVNQNFGFDPTDVRTARLQLPETPKSRLSVEQMRLNLTDIPGVASATAIAIYPPLSGAATVSVEVGGRQSQADQRWQFLPILPDYFKTLQVRVVQGNEFRSAAGEDASPVAVINETAARRFWPNENPLGKYVRIRSPQLPDEQPRRVVGVVTEIAQYSYQEPRPQLYVPYRQLGSIRDVRLAIQLRTLTFLLRSKGPVSELTPAVTAAIERTDPAQSVSPVTTMEQNAYAGPQRRRVLVGLFTLLGAIATLLAVVGVYGIMAHSVSQRFNEFGIRIALGADPKRIRGLVVRRGGALIGTGLVAGMALSLAFTRILESSFVFIRASAMNAIALLIGVVLLGGVALLACCIPALRASRVDAVVALRHD